MTRDTSTASASDTVLSLQYQEVIQEVIRPLPSHVIKVRPGATTRDKKKALALAYYDWRIMVNRLNRLVGGEQWYARLQPWGDHKIICTLTILGVPKDSSGEGEANDENDGTAAEQQAKKRAMAEHGLNYLYLLPQVWGDYDAEKKRFVNPQSIVEEMYRSARIEGLDLVPYITSTRKPSSPPAATAASTEPSTPTEPAAAEQPTASLNEKTMKSIRKLCEVLSKPEPVYATLTVHSAHQLLHQLSNEYRAARARSAAPSVSPKMSTERETNL